MPAAEAIVPSMDDFTMTEITNMVDELKHELNLGGEEEEDLQIEERKEADDNQSALALFDKLQIKEDKELDDSVSSVISSNSFRSVSTRKLKLTVLNQKAYSQIYVQDVYQLITSKIGKMVRSQSLMIVLQTYPFGGKVPRLAIDLVQLRNFQVTENPVTTHPPLPLVRGRRGG